MTLVWMGHNGLMQVGPFSLKYMFTRSGCISSISRYKPIAIVLRAGNVGGDRYIYAVLILLERVR